MLACACVSEVVRERGRKTGNGKIRHEEEKEIKKEELKELKRVRKQERMRKRKWKKRQ